MYKLYRLRYSAKPRNYSESLFPQYSIITGFYYGYRAGKEAVEGGGMASWRRSIGPDCRMVTIDYELTVEEKINLNSPDMSNGPSGALKLYARELKNRSSHVDFPELLKGASLCKGCRAP